MIDITLEAPGLAPEVIRQAWTTFDPERRCRLWPNLSSDWYELHSVDTAARTADVREGMNEMGGIWAREQYEWNEDASYIKSWTSDSNVFLPGAVEVWIDALADGSGSKV